MAFLEKKRFFSIILFFLVAVEIFFISSIPGSKAPSGIKLVPIVYHFCVFFLFNFFLFFATKENEKTNRFHILIVFLFSLIYAIADELHQRFVPLRSPSVNDVLIDFIGISFSLLIAIFISKKSNQ